MAHDHRGVGSFEDRGADVLEALLHAALGEHRRQAGPPPVAAENQAGREDERGDRQHHHRISMTPSNMSAGRLMPDARNRSQTFGRTPVALKRPTTFPSWLMPVFSNRKISCMVM